MNALDGLSQNATWNALNQDPVGFRSDFQGEDHTWKLLILGKRQKNSEKPVCYRNFNCPRKIRLFEYYLEALAKIRSLLCTSDGSEAVEFENTKLVMKTLNFSLCFGGGNHESKKVSEISSGKVYRRDLNQHKLLRREALALTCWRFSRKNYSVSPIPRKKQVTKCLHKVLCASFN